MKKTLLLFALLCATSFSAVADKGMWLPSLISSRIKDMKSKGLQALCGGYILYQSGVIEGCCGLV